MSEGKPQASREDGLRAYARWRMTQGRYDRLQSVFDDEICITAAIERGRYLRLCSQIALASEIAEAAREKLLVLLGEAGSPQE